MTQSDTNESSVQILRRDILAQVANLSPDATQDEVLDVLGRIAAAKDAIRELGSMAEEAAIQWIEANGDIEVGDVRYYVGTNRTTKCTDTRATMEAALNATGGDIDAMCELLSSGAWKPGACRKTLSPDDFDMLFTTSETLDLKTGKPKRGLQRVDQRFIK